MSGAPGWRELRQHRIAQQSKERARRKQEKRRGRMIDDDDEDEDRPRTTSRTGKRSASAGSRKASAVVSRERLKKQRGLIERSMAWLVLLLSFLGTIAALHGGFGPMAATLASGQLNQAALLGGVLIQLIVTVLEWYYFDIWQIAWGARLIDTGATAIGYGPLLTAPITLLLYNRGIADPIPAAWGIIILASLGIAWFPESRLVD